MGGPNRLRRRVLARAAFLGLNQQQLARLSLMDEGSLSRALRHSDSPRTETLEKIGRALDMSVDELCSGDDAAVIKPHRGVVDASAENWEPQIQQWLTQQEAR